MTSQRARLMVSIALVSMLLAGLVVVLVPQTGGRVHVVAYFDNSNGIYPGDDVVLLGVPIGKITSIEPQPQRAKITFWFHDEYDVPADAEAVILSPQLITARAIQLTPAYNGGPTLENNAVIGQNRTAVPMEWDDFRAQLEKLTGYLQPAEPDGTSPLGGFVNTAADHLAGEGANICHTIVQLSQSISALGDHSDDVFTTVKNLSTLVSALHSSTDLMQQLNRNLAAVSGELANDPGEVGSAIADMHTAVTDVTGFLADNRESLGTTADTLASVSTAVVESLDDIEQALHVGPTTLQNVTNTYEPAHGTLTGIPVLNTFADPISFLCGAIQAAARMGFEESAKLCVQYLAPIVKNRQYNFPPIGMNPIVGATARPNEITYSEDWLRPGHRSVDQSAETLADLMSPAGTGR
ncbi:MCE family protein [Mycolicibacterium thermoresistibile]